MDESEFERESSGNTRYVTIDRKLVGHKSFIRSIVVFNSESRIVSGSYDYTIRIWDFLGRCLKILKHHVKSVRSLMKWNEDVFFSSSRDGKVFEYSIRNFEKLRTVYSNRRTDIVSMTKISEDSVCFVDEKNSELLVIQYSTGKFLGLRRISFHLQSTVIVSKAYDNAFYINCGDKNDYNVILASFNQNKVLKVFTEPKNQNNSIANYLNQEREEILIVSDGLFVLFFRTSDKSSNSFAKISNVNCKCILMFQNRFLFLDILDKIDKISFFDTNQEDFHEKPVHFFKNGNSASVSRICVFSPLVVNHEIKLLICSPNNEMSIVRAKHVLFENNFERRDLQDRLSFVTEGNFFSEEEENGIFIKITICDSSLLIFKSFLFSN